MKNMNKKWSMRHTALVECKKTDKYPFDLSLMKATTINRCFGVGSKIDYSTGHPNKRRKFNPLEGMYNSYLSGHHFNNLNFPKQEHISKLLKTE